MKGWLLASVDGKKIGAIPANYVRVLGKKRGSIHNQAAEYVLSDNVPPPADSPSVNIPPPVDSAVVIDTTVCASGEAKTNQGCCNKKNIGDIPVYIEDADNYLESSFKDITDTRSSATTSNAEMDAQDILGSID